MYRDGNAQIILLKKMMTSSDSSKNKALLYEKINHFFPCEAGKPTHA